LLVYRDQACASRAAQRWASSQRTLDQPKKDGTINAYDLLCTTHGRDRFLVSGACASAGILERAQPAPKRGDGGGDGSDKQLQSQRYDVTATVVDVAGTPQVVLRGDHATLHTRESSFRKAYTIITLGPIFHVDVTSELLAMLSKFPPLAAQALANTSNVAVLPGGVAFKAGDETIGGIGVGGSPGGDKDEACAKAGVAKVRDLLPH
jgi:uncharacterized protein GlcG (DUF336 family)